jgi:hypothetical protein
MTQGQYVVDDVAWWQALTYNSYQHHERAERLRRASARHEIRAVAGHGRGERVGQRREPQRRGLHSSTSQLNLGCFRHKLLPKHPLILPDTP